MLNETCKFLASAVYVGRKVNANLFAKINLKVILEKKKKKKH